MQRLVPVFTPNGERIEDIVVRGDGFERIGHFLRIAVPFYSFKFYLLSLDGTHLLHFHPFDTQLSPSSNFCTLDDIWCNLAEEAAPHGNALKVWQVMNRMGTIDDELHSIVRDLNCDLIDSTKEVKQLCTATHNCVIVDCARPDIHPQVHDNDWDILVVPEESMGTFVNRECSASNWLPERLQIVEDWQADDVRQHWDEFFLEQWHHHIWGR